MTIHEYGKSNAKTVVLVHPSVVMWDFFEYLIPLLEKDCHVIIPALPGYDENDSQQNFTSVENIAGELAEWLVKNKITIPEGVDPELLMKVLGNPEMAALLTSLAKTMKV